MNFDDFVKKYNGKGIDFDYYAGFQCVDLYRVYVKEVFGCPQSPPVRGAKDIWDTYLPQYFDRIPNTPTGVPVKGDIIIWGLGIGPYGHVGVFSDGNVNKFNSFDQNFPVGTLCHIQKHDYKGVLGWLRYKKPVVDPLQKVVDDVRRACDENTTNVSKIAKIKSLVL